ncbi:MAG: MFS transporter [Bacteroidaceae bacterium]|nr:MFS transporter [Bacteroidaceae bacterium]
MSQNKNNKSRNPISWVPTAYFAMGLPFVVLNMVTVLMFEGLGVDKKLITFWTSLILLPYTLKPLWSPFLELFKTKKFWVITTQFVTGITFGLVAFSLGLPNFFSIAIALLAIVGFSGATHDIACDGVYMSELDEKQQAQYIGWQGAFYNIAKIVATGGLVYLAGQLIKHFTDKGNSDLAANEKAWMIIIGLLGAIMVILALYHLFMLPSSKKSKSSNRSGKEVMNELADVLLDFFRKKNIWYYITFIILYRFAEGFVMKIVPLFLKAQRADGGLGLDVDTIGLYYGTYGAIAFVLGSILAGYYIKGIGLRRALFHLCCIFNIPFLVYTLFAIYQPTQGWLICSGIVFEYFGYGFGFVGLTLFMMQQVAPGKSQMAHYAFASGIMNLGVMLPGMLSGWLCENFESWFNKPGGFEPFFIFVLFATIPAFLITWFVPFREETADVETN